MDYEASDKVIGGAMNSPLYYCFVPGLFIGYGYYLLVILGMLSTCYRIFLGSLLLQTQGHRRTFPLTNMGPLRLLPSRATALKFFATARPTLGSNRVFTDPRVL